MPYLSTLELWSRRGAIQIHVYLYLYLTFIIFIIIVVNLVIVVIVTIIVVIVCYVLSAVHPAPLSAEGDSDKPSSVAGSSADVDVPAAVSAVAEEASRQFSPQLTAKILELLCDELVSDTCLSGSGSRMYPAH